MNEKEEDSMNYLNTDMMRTEMKVMNNPNHRRKDVMMDR